MLYEIILSNFLGLVCIFIIIVKTNPTGIVKPSSK